MTEWMRQVVTRRGLWCQTSHYNLLHHDVQRDSLLILMDRTPPGSLRGSTINTKIQLLPSLMYTYKGSKGIFFLTRLDYHGTVCVCIQGWEGNFLIDERRTKNTIHYHPLQAISFPTALLSETILFIDGKINHQQGGGRDKWNQWRICIQRANQLATDKGVAWFRDVHAGFADASAAY